ncbi:MAG: hypothetical protein HPY83_11780 [Anaerolineae bacterium]|nr:hypothetical protein [Anaerolineae bacterium]
MTGRERVWAAIRFHTPDRIPLIYGVLPGAVDRYGAELSAIMARYPSDFAGQERALHGTAEDPHYRQGTDVDAWGCIWKNMGLGTEGQIVGHPLADWSALPAYRPPDPGAEDWAAVDDTIEEGRRRGKFVMFGAGRLFERMHFLRGYDRLLLDIAEDRPEVERLRDLVLAHDLAVAELVAQRDTDGISYMDDWGTQSALMIRPDRWRSLFKPAYRKLVQVAHDAGKAFYFHSDGCIAEIIPDLIEVGVDVLNPQFSCHDLDELAQLCRGRVCISTDLDRQQVLPYGTPDDVRQYTRRVIESLALPEGGLIGRAEAAPDTPPANIEAAYAVFACHRFGSGQNDGSQRPLGGPRE